MPPHRQSNGSGHPTVRVLMRNAFRPLTALAVAGIFLSGTSVPADPVWNVNVGNGTVPITTADNYIGAATENTTNSTWNSVTTTTLATLADSTGSNSQGVTFKITPLATGTPTPTMDFGSGGAGDKIFYTWIKDTGNNDLFQISFSNLPGGSGATYDLVVYSEWHWANSDGVPVSLITGTGLTGIFYINHGSSRTNGSAITPLLEDTNAANVNSPTQNPNYARFRGLSPDGGILTFSMGGVNAAVNGFQLIQTSSGAPDTTPPTPNPMTWASAPAAAGSSSSITMTATTASDPSGVEYFFYETSGNSGGSDSGWQNSPVYTDTGLNANTSYTYTVKARDKSPSHYETSASAPASATTLAAPTTIVWNVNIGNQVATADNYAGAVPQSSPINWNSITTSSYTGLALKDSTGSTTGGITLDLTSDRNPDSQSLTSGDKIFIGWFGGAGASSSFTLRGLTIAKTYDILFYSDWYWKNGDSLPITQTAGTGLSGTFFLNRILSGSNGTVPTLTPDTNPANVTSGAGNIGNYCRIVGIVPDATGKVSFRMGDGANTAFSGFQLVQTGVVPPRADMLNLSLPSNPPSIRDAVFSGTNVTLTVPYGMAVTNLAPIYTLWPGATCPTASGTARNFTTPQTYTVTSSDSLVTKNYNVTAVIAPPLPGFTLTAPSTWDGRTTITVQPNITNLALLQATGGTNFTYQWSVDGVAVTTQITPGILTLTRSQGSGLLLVTLTMANGTEAVTNSTTIQVQEPATDPWVERTPVANEKPVNGQFFARNPFTDLGTIFYRGTQSGTPDTVYLKVYKTPSGGSETLETTHRQSLVGGAYSLTAPIAAGLITYRVVYGTTTGGTNTDVATVTNLVCGDAYIIDGQSNAQATDNSESQVDTSNPWIKTYDASLGWGPAYAKPTSPNWGSKVGFWGMKLATSIVTNHQMPVCIINGSVGGTMISQHQANPANHTVGAGTYDIYANLLNRVIAARLTHGIRGIFWHQGESDCSNYGPILDYDYTVYEQNFLSMSAAWKQDYPNFQRYIIYQVMPNPCGIGPTGDQLREVQRRLPRLYSKMSILNTLGIVGYEGCHFSKLGYDNMANRMLPIVSRDFYGVNPSSAVTAPNLKRAYFTSAARTAIALEFDLAMSWSSFSTPNYYINDVVANVSSGSASGNIVTLQLSAAAAANATLDYLKDSIWNPSEGVSTLLNGANGIPALSFADVSIGAPPDLSAPTLAGSAIVDDKNGGPITVNTPVTYTVTFSEDMDASTVSAADFGNAGDATVTIGTVTETTPGVFTVQATPTTAGTLRLKVNAGAELKDVAGNALNTTSAILDDTPINVTAVGPSGPGLLTNSVSGGVLTLSWPAGQSWRLECQTNALTKGLGTNWVEAAGSSVNSTNITIHVTQPTVFYRLIYP